MMIMKKNMYALLICTSLVSLCNGMKNSKGIKDLETIMKCFQNIQSSHNSMINFLREDQEAKAKQGLAPNKDLDAILKANQSFQEVSQGMAIWMEDLQKREIQKEKIINAAPQLNDCLQQIQTAKAQLGENATDEQKAEILEPSIQKLKEILEPFKPASPENNAQTPEIIMSQQEEKQ